MAYSAQGHFGKPPMGLLIHQKQPRITMLIWLIVIIGVISVVVLNIEGTKTVSGSEIHSESEKRKYRLMIWALPLIGTFWAMWLINKDIRKKQHEMEDEIAPVIKELGDSLKKLESGIQRKHNKSKLH